VRAIDVALDHDAAELVRRDWQASRMPLPLEIVEPPFRSLEQPVLETVGAVTARPDRLVGPASDGLWKDLLHNERSLYLGWLLRFEPRVVMCSVPPSRRI
jgi:hypothetical protein